MPRKFVTEAIVLPRRVLWHAEGVHLPGARLTIADEEFDTLHADGIVDVATPEHGAAVSEAIEQGLPVPGYVSTKPDEPGDPTDPLDVGRRARCRASRAP